MRIAEKEIFKDSNIKAILFDSGKVLNGPSTGYWFITPGFFTYVDRNKFKSIPSHRKKAAFDMAGEYINKQNLILDENEEFKHFLEYYRIFSKCLPELQLTEEGIKVITVDYVYNYNKYTFFTEAVKLIPELSKSYKLGVISDAWPSLEGVFKNAGLRNYFSSFIISSKLGVTKPNELMYKKALDELGILPGEAIFIDDNIRNCIGAERIGIKSLHLCRGWKDYFHSKLFNGNNNAIKSLYEVRKVLSQDILNLV